jgi:EAL domain-containing protein (putative c-di-GMP-specific phosphodiesterase class I)/GGDEF domain-containing protein
VDSGPRSEGHAAPRFELRAVDLPATPSTGTERFTRALVELTRTVWHPRCDFETAIGSIAETAAAVLGVDSVSVWQFDHDSARLECLCTYAANALRHRPDPSLAVVLANTDLVSTLREVRTFEGIEVDAPDAPGQGTAQDAFRGYLQRSHVRSLLNAPAYVEGELLGIICHEVVGRARKWTSEEVMFAASMGDYVAMACEIARRRRAESEIEHLRLHDGSTGLGNRDYMLELIRQRMDTAHAPGEIMAVVHVLVDATGGVAWSADAPSVDEVMAQIAQRLRRLSSEVIDIARVRDNGFAFLLASDSSQRSAVRLAERVIAAIRAMTWAHEEVHPSVTVGIAFADSEGADDARVALRQAEEAAEHSRAAEKFSYEIFDPEHHAALVETLRFERTLREAFEAGQFELHYQPEIDAASRQWVAAEALLRWRREDRVLSAAEFIGVIEATGLMLPVGRWVLQQACADAASWSTGTGRGVTVRVNVSARQFDEDGLLADVEAALASSGLEPGMLCLELTETTLMRDIGRTQDVLERLRELGVHVAIDDFGTGYASLVYLKRLPVDALKIDRSFVEGMPNATTDAAIIRAVVGLATSLRMEVIAEGVETAAQQAALLALGVTRMQGWLYGKAMPLGDLQAVLGTAAPG